MDDQRKLHGPGGQGRHRDRGHAPAEKEAGEEGREDEKTGFAEEHAGDFRRVKPSTRRVASSRPRSESAIRPVLYTTPKAMMAAKAILKARMRRRFSEMVFRNDWIPADLRLMPAAAGMAFNAGKAGESLAVSMVRNAPETEGPSWSRRLRLPDSIHAPAPEKSFSSAATRIPAAGRDPSRISTVTLSPGLTPSCSPSDSESTMPSGGRAVSLPW